MIRLYGCGSPNVFKVQLMLAECGLDYIFEAVPLFDGSLRAPAFRALNPNGRLPLLVDDGVPIFESGAILVHLAEKTGRFLPAEGEGRTRVFQWLMWQMAGVGPMLGQALHFRYIAPAGSDYGKARYGREAERLYDVAEARLRQAEWLAGDEYSIADIAAFPWLGRYSKRLGIDLSARPAVAEWARRIEARPATLAIAAEVTRLFKADRDAMDAASPAERDIFFGR